MKVFALFLAMLGLTVSAPAQLAPKIHLERFVRGFENPLYLTHDGTDRLFVVEQPGRIKIVKDGQVLPKPFLDIRKEVDFGGEKGLLGLAFHPDFKHNGYFYVDYTAPKPKLHTVIAEFKVDPNSPTTTAATLSSGLTECSTSRWAMAGSTMIRSTMRRIRIHCSARSFASM
jgi:glucose/arabinose dehydrogenase